MTDEFTRMMLADGVRHKSAPRGDQPQPRSSTPRHAPVVQTSATPASQPTETARSYAWRAGADARRTLDVALEKLTSDRRRGAAVWANGIRQDGTCMTLPTSSVPALLSEADRRDMRLVVIAGDGWTCVLHPQLGTATLDLDPIGAAR